MDWIGDLQRGVRPCDEWSVLGSCSNPRIVAAHAANKAPQKADCARIHIFFLGEQGDSHILEVFMFHVEVIEARSRTALRFDGMLGIAFASRIFTRY